MKNLFPNFIIIFTFFYACNSEMDTPNEVKSSKQEINILLTDPVETLDPLEVLYFTDWQVTSNIFESLVAFDDDENILPELAKSVSISKDRLKYTFYLRDDVYFQDSPCFKNGIGRKFNAFDVQYTFERLANKHSNFVNLEMINGIIKGVKDFHERKEESISGIIVKDSLTISFILERCFQPFLKILASPNFYILPKEAVKYFGKEFRNHPVGTGPFRISEFRKFKKVQLVRNENYYLKDEANKSLPYISSICYSTISKSENAFEQFINNSTNIIKLNNSAFNRINKDDFLMKEYKTITVDKGNGLRFWGFNFVGNNVINLQIRKAIVKLYDRSFIADNNKLAESLVPGYLIGNNKIEWYKCERLSSEHNLGEKSTNDTIKILSNIVTPDLLELEKVLSELKLKFKRIIKPDNYYKNIINLKPDIFRVSMLPSYPAPIEYYSLFYSKSSKNINLGGFCNKEFDDIYEKILFESDPSTLIKYYVKLESILKEKVAVIYLTHHGPIHYILPQNLENIHFKYVQIDFRNTYFK